MRCTWWMVISTTLICGCSRLSGRAVGKIVINADPRQVSVQAPAVMAAGDSLLLIVKDSSWNSVFSMDVRLDTMTEVNAATVIGGGGFKALPTAFPNVLQAVTKAAMELPESDSALRVATAVRRAKGSGSDRFNILGNAGSTPGVKQRPLDKMVANATSALTSQGAALRKSTQAVNDQLDSLHRLVVIDPDAASILAFLHDEVTRRLAFRLAADSDVVAVENTVIALSMSADPTNPLSLARAVHSDRQAMARRTAQNVDDDDVDGIRQQGDQREQIPLPHALPDSALAWSAYARGLAFARRVQVLAARLPSALGTSSTGKSTLFRNLESLAAAIVQLDSALARTSAAKQALGTLWDMARAAGIPDNSLHQAEVALSTDIAAAPFSDSIVAGVNVLSLVRTNGGVTSDLESEREDFALINQHVAQLATDLTLLPTWVVRAKRDSVAAMINVPLPYDDRRLTVSVYRHDRFGPFSVVTMPAATATATGKSGDNQKQDTTHDTTANGSAGASPLISVSGLAGPKQDSLVATVQIAVVKRYHFEIAAGLVVSALHAKSYSTVSDSTTAGKGAYLHIDGDYSHQYLPTAMLSYDILPFRGRVTAAQAYDSQGFLQRSGVSIDLGVGLSNPTQNIYIGLSSAPLPGLRVGLGMNASNVSTSTYQDGDFVPASKGSPVVSRWRTAPALVVGVDGDVIGKAFGALLGFSGS